MTSHELAFGIGCEYFDAKGKNMEEWKRSVASTLEALPSVTDLQINTTELDELAVDKERWESQEYNTPISGSVKFAVSIPIRLHSELNSFKRSYPYLGEKFEVVINYHYWSPITFVIPSNQSGPSSDDGSASIVLVREFLERELKARPGSARHMTIGPSPFHVDASIASNDEQDEPFKLIATKRSGYDRYRFMYSASEFASVEEGAAWLFEILTRELALFYALVRQGDKRLDSAEDIADETQQLLEFYNDRKLWARLRRFFVGGSLLRSLALKAITAESVAQRDMAAAQINLTNHYEANNFPCFKEYLYKEVSDTDATDLSTAREITSLLEQTRSRQIEAASLFLSALAGGLAGALVSLSTMGTSPASQPTLAYPGDRQCTITYHSNGNDSMSWTASVSVPGELITYVFDNNGNVYRHVVQSSSGPEMFSAPVPLSKINGIGGVLYVGNTSYTCSVTPH